MQTVQGPIWDIWNNGGPFMGEQGKPHTRVTVELGWNLKLWTTQLTGYSRGPVRYFLDPNHVTNGNEVEVTNIKSVEIDRSLDQDAATCNIVIFNQDMGTVSQSQLGDPGHYTFSHGESGESQARWGQAANSWEEVLTPNALIRTYQGYGANDQTWQNALSNGNIIQTGTWLVDEVDVTTDGTMHLKCRDMAKLLIDQQLYPPLVPSNFYPIQYLRWYWVNQDYHSIAYGNAVHDVKWIDSMALSPNNDGYWMVGSDGGVFTYGDLQFYGSLDGDVVDPTSIVDIMPVIHPNPVSGPGEPATIADGYFVVSNTGSVFAFGNATWQGDASSLGHTDFCSMTGKSDGSGYWLLRQDGTVYTYGAASYYGNAAVTGYAVDIAVTPSGNGYWITDYKGEVFTQGDATYHGGESTTTHVGTIVGLAPTPSGAGYWLAGSDGGVYSFGDATFYGSIPGMATPIVLNDPVNDIVATPDGHGYYLIARDGGVFNFGDSQFFGSLPGNGSNAVPIEGNYKDLTDIIRDLLLWSGFWLNDGSGKPDVFGLLEQTGTYLELSALGQTAGAGGGQGKLDPAMQSADDHFDKHPPIDAINQIKSIVGYIFYVDETGAANWISPNYWSPGNQLPNGQATNFIPEIDEKVQMTQYQMNFNDTAMRSSVTIANMEPLAGAPGTITATYVPQASVKYLKGLVKPAEMISYFLTNQTQSEIMAELLALYMWFQQRMGQVTCAANPCIQINDQVRLYERQSSETYIHYVRGIRTNHNLDQGDYTMTLTTHWMGDANNWSIQAPTSTTTEVVPPF